jgi:isoquinoline 1-oxidoreductase subunit beta
MPAPRLTRRTLLVGGGAGVGLILAWALWPRRYEPTLSVREGETLFNAYLKIGRDGRVIVAVPQTELGQGVYTSLPQILADELGADWRAVEVEPAPLSPLYANRLLATEQAAAELPSWAEGIGRWAAREYATRTAMMLTGGSTSVRAFEAPLRQAGAAARALLSMAAAERWETDWETLETAGGFVLGDGRRLAFAELAEAAAGYDVPPNLPARGGGQNRLAGQALPRLDAPAKVDGSLRFAGDVRLPDMLFASIRNGVRAPADRNAAERVAGFVSLVEQPGWVAAAATTWWAAEQALQYLRPARDAAAAAPDSRRAEAALGSALSGADPARLIATGDLAGAAAAGGGLHADYAVAPAPNAPLETLTATARLQDDRLEIWAPTQAPGFARAAAARGADVSESNVTLYPMPAGGGYGRKLETRAIEQVAAIARALGRPVQLTWPREEEIAHDTPRPPVQAQLRAWLRPGGRIAGWHARIAAPATTRQVIGRLRRGESGPAGLADPAALDGAVPPYAIPAIAIDHLPAEIGLDTGIWRSGAHSYAAFFTESFVDELARQAGIEPLSFRMGLLTGNARLARTLTTAAALGGWDGGARGSRLGLAAHSAFGSHAALLVEVAVEGQRVRVARTVCAVDCGRVINPELVRQQIEGGIIHGISGATGAPLRFEDGRPNLRRLGELGLPTLADSPDIVVELIESQEPPGGITELAVPPVAPAVANAIYAATGRRLRTLPLDLGAA